VNEPELDHIVFGVPDLVAASRQFAELTGVQPAPGGRHVGLGTANCLVGLGEAAYLEIIGPDPDAPPPARPRPFGIDDLTESRVVTWAVRTSDIDAHVHRARRHGFEPGPPRDMSRSTPAGDVLSWRLTLDENGVGSGVVPFLIDWGQTPHPAGSGLPQLTLVSLQAICPDPQPVRSAFAALGVSMPVVAGNREVLLVRLDSPTGPVVFV
jgi:hypothetical protein